MIQRAGRLCRHARDDKGNLLDPDAEDQRGKPLLVVYGPDPVEDPGGDWYRSMFSKAAYVYPDHAKLWLTSRLLKTMGGWTTPDDSRSMIEQIYGTDMPVPEGLADNANEAYGQIMAERSLAKAAELDLDEGYKATESQWIDDTKAVTRLGEIQTTVRLGKWVNNHLRPWRDKDHHPWQMSQLSVRQALISKEADHENQMLMQAVKTAKESMPDKGRWSVLIPMKKGYDSDWYGKATDGNDKTVHVKYSMETGFEIKKEGEE